MTINRETLSTGTLVRTGPGGSGRGYIFAIHGEQRPETLMETHSGTGFRGGNAVFEVVFECGRFSGRIPEGILRGPGWTICPQSEGFATREQLVDLCAVASEQNALRVEKHKEGKARHEQAIAALRSDPAYLHLSQGDDSTGTLAAKNIRAELKQTYPKTKFSVRKIAYGVIVVRWRTTPAKEAIEAILSRYRLPCRDDQSDAYQPRETPWNVVFGCAAFISIDFY